MAHNTPRNSLHPRLMKALIVFGLFILIAFPLGMLFVGFSTLEINCIRNQAGEPPDCEIREVRLLGLFDRRVTALKVNGVGYRTGDVATNSRVTLASTVVLDASNGSIAVSQAASNVGSDWKSAMIGKIRRFLAAPDERTLSLRVLERNLFGWIGVVLFAFIVLSYIAWFIRKVTGRA